MKTKLKNQKRASNRSNRWKPIKQAKARITRKVLQLYVADVSPELAREAGIPCKTNFTERAHKACAALWPGGSFELVRSVLVMAAGHTLRLAMQAAPGEERLTFRMTSVVSPEAPAPCLQVCVGRDCETGETVACIMLETEAPVL
jgi:hypothetical protein